MIEVWMSPTCLNYLWQNAEQYASEIRYYHDEAGEYLGINQQLFAQIPGWA